MTPSEVRREATLTVLGSVIAMVDGRHEDITALTRGSSLRNVASAAFTVIERLAEEVANLTGHDPAEVLRNLIFEYLDA